MLKLLYTYNILQCYVDYKYLYMNGYKNFRISDDDAEYSNFYAHMYVYIPTIRMMKNNNTKKKKKELQE